MHTEPTTTAPTHDDIMAALTARKHWEQRQATWYQMRHDGLRRRNKPWPNAADMHYPLADGIIEKLKPLAKEGDIVVVFSNGGFDGIHQKLLDRL
jgi:FMN phosphatase YigB (HAD superfamily)